MRAAWTALVGIGFFVVGCSHVAPYERGTLAHPTMATAGFLGPAAGHLNAVQEGATGGRSVSESGCGCN
jgi:hypothetical protein